MDGIYLALDGKQAGPFTLDQAWKLYAQGTVTRETPAWYEGLEDWTTFVKIVEAFPAHTLPQSKSAIDKPATETKGAFTKDELRNIANAQNTLMFSVLAGFAILFIEKLPLIGPLAMIFVGIFQIYALYMLGIELRLRMVWLYCVGMIIPFVNLIILLIVSAKASKVLRAAGVRIGLMGGNLDDIKN
jgi:hypothetical protein